MVISREDRKRASDDYKNRPRHRGVFAVRCAPTGRTWVGASPNLDAAKNGLWFSLRSGGAREAELLAAWREHGEDAFTFEVLEELDEDVAEMLIGDQLLQKKQAWAEREHARTLLP